MDRQAFREQLHANLRNKLLSSLQDYIEKRFENYAQILRLISALDRKYDDSNVIREGLPNIFGKISKHFEKDEEEYFAEFYVSAVHNFASDFPNEVIWEQKEDRFSSVDSDSIAISIAKSGKDLARFSSKKWHTAKQTASGVFGGSVDDWEPWTQHIPLQRVITYHLLDEEIVRGFIHNLERLQLKIITEIEDQLLNHQKEDSPKNGLDLPALVDELQNKVNTTHVALEQKITKEVNELESKLVGQIEKIGTIEKNASFYREQRVENKTIDVKQMLVETEKQWLNTEKLMLGRTQNLTQFRGLLEDVGKQDKEFLRDFEEYFQQKLQEPLDEFYDLLEESIQLIKKDHSADLIKQQKEQLAEFVREGLIEGIQHLQDQQVFRKKAEHFSEDLLVLVNQVPETMAFIYDFQNEKEPPTINQREIEWRLLLVRVLREQILNDIRPSKQKYDEFLSDMLRNLVEIEDIIEINLESALTASREQVSDYGSDPDDIAVEALKRLLSKVDDLRNRSITKLQQIEKTVTEGEQNFAQSLIVFLQDGDAKDLQILRAKYRVKETTKDWQNTVDAKVANAQDRISVWSRLGGKKSKKYLSKIQKFFGYGEQKIEETKRADIATYLSETDQKMKELPYIYRRLFKFDEIADTRFYVSVPEAALTFKKAYEQWMQSFSATFAVVGEKGSGKSTFLNMVVAREVNSSDLIKIELKSTISTEVELVNFLKEKLDIDCNQSVDEIIETIHQWEKKPVVAIDCIQNCFVRNINGYEALEKLCYLISETKGEVFWVVSCSRYGWRFLDKTQSISEYFSHVIQTDTLNADQIETIILSRHRSSGYSIHFEPGSDTKNSRSYRKLQNDDEKAQDYLKERYFEKLTELAEGNASIAMILWIRSIRDFDDAHFYIQPLEVTAIELIEDLSPQVLFTLAAFVLHDTLSDTDLSKILNLTKEESRLMLIRLRSRGLLLKDGDYYYLNQLMYRQIVRVLKERNIIHLV